MSIAKTSLVLTLIALLSRVLGLGRDLAISWTFGANSVTDGFYIASSLTYAAYIVVGASLANITIPFMAGRSDAEEVVNSRDVSSVLNIAILLLSGLAALGMLNAGTITGVLAGGANADLLAATTTMIALLMPTTVLLGASGILAGILNHHRVFAPVAAAPAVLNVGVVLFVVVLAPSIGIYSAVLGTLVGSFFFLVIQLPLLYRLNYKHSWRISIGADSLRQFLGPAVPVMAVALLTYAYTFVDIAAGARIGAGAVTAINVATKLIQLPQGVIAMGLTTVSFPILSKLIQEQKRAEASKLTMSLTIAILFIAVPVAGFMSVSAEPITSILFGRGTFSEEAVLESSQVLSILVISLPGYAVNIFLLRALYALKSWRVPVIAFGLGFIVKFLLAFLLIESAGIFSVGLSTVFSIYIVTVVMLYSINRLMESPFDRRFWHSVARILLATLATSLVVGGLRWIFPADLIRPDEILFAFLTVSASIVFGLFCFLLLRNEVGYLRSAR